MAGEVDNAATAPDLAATAPDLVRQLLIRLADDAEFAHLMESDPTAALHGMDVDDDTLRRLTAAMAAVRGTPER